VGYTALISIEWSQGFYFLPGLTHTRLGPNLGRPGNYFLIDLNNTQYLNKLGWWKNGITAMISIENSK